MEIRLFRIEKDQPEQMDIRCHEVTDEIREIVTFVKTRQGQLSGMLVERATTFALQEHLMPRRLLSWSPHYQGLALSFAICGLFSMVLQWQQNGFNISPSEMATIASTMLTQPLIQP